jgi:alkylation response protein AidB-like acyl-CoA dehydrogenase
MISIANQGFAGWMPKEGSQEVFAPDRTNAAAFIGIKALATPLDGGYQVSGRWPFASGAPHSPWAAGMCPVAGDDTRNPDGSPRTRVCFFAPEDWEMVDTWDAVGLRGTGSHDLRVDDAFVPERRSFFLEDPPNTEGTLWKRPFYFAAPPVHAAHALGAARGIIDAFMEITVGTRTNPLEKIQDRPVVQAQLGEAEAILRSVRPAIYDNVLQGWQRTVAGQPTTPPQFTETMLLVAHTVQSCIRVADLMFNAAGGKGVYTRNRLERYWRDLHVAGQHMTPSLQQYTNAGRAMLGLA